MPYVPPHLRGAAASGAPEPERDSGGGRGGGGYDDRGRGGRGYDDGGRGGGGGGYDRGGYGGGGGYDRGGGGYDRGGREDYGGRGGGGGGDRGGYGGRGDDRGYGRGVGEEAPPRRGGGGGGGGGGGANFAEWKPSARVLAMTEEMTADVRKRLNVTVTVEEGQPPCQPAVESFEDIGLHNNIILDIRYHDYEKPTPIQSQAMPVALSGRDILGCAETGSGKTASFAIPMIQHVLNQSPVRRGDGPIGLVLAPTRELAQQIEKEIKAFSRTSKTRTAIIVGGTHMGDQRSDLRNGVEIVVATPGRFIDHLEQGNTFLSRVSYVVLDEADRMLDMGFEPQIRNVMCNLPVPHQTLLFSATMPPEIETLAGEYLNHPVQIKVGSVSTPAATVSQHLVKTVDGDKVDALLSLLMEEAHSAEQSGHTLPLTIVFVERKLRCDEIADALCAEGLGAVALHGGRSQGEREAALREFAKGVHTSILVATDVASRGLDISGIAHVINMDLPKTLEDYVHRIGRTGRAGAQGRATSFYTDRDSYIVAQIRHALSEAERGNLAAFATGREARRKDREMAAAWRKGEQGPGAVEDEAAAVGSVQVTVADPKLKAMLNMTGGADAPAAGGADDAWDD